MKSKKNAILIWCTLFVLTVGSLSACAQNPNQSVLESFACEDTAAEIQTSANTEPEDNATDGNIVALSQDNKSYGTNEWANYPDGIRIEQVTDDSYNAHVMVIRDPAQVYIGISTQNGFSTDIPGKRITEAIEDEDAIAAINAGAFNDDGKADSSAGSVPEGLVYSQGSCAWKTGAPPNGITGFAGFDEDNVLIVRKENISQEQAEELNIRDGCCFGPVLIMDGEINMEAYNNVTGLNPRTAIGQREDGAVIFVCIDGRQPSSKGGEYSDIIDIMVEYGAVNACNMDGGSSTAMMYRDTYGQYGTAGQIRMINCYPALQQESRKMPSFRMVGSVNKE